MSEGSGSLQKTGGGSLDRSLLIDRQVDTGDSALSSSSTQSLLEAIFWTSVSLRGRTVTLTLSSKNKKEFAQEWGWANE